MNRLHVSLVGPLNNPLVDFPPGCGVRHPFTVDQGSLPRSWISSQRKRQ